MQLRENTMQSFKTLLQLDDMQTFDTQTVPGSLAHMPAHIDHPCSHELLTSNTDTDTNTDTGKTCLTGIPIPVSLPVSVPNTKYNVT